MKVLVTGGAGFIGSHLVDRLLAAGHRVTVVDNCTTGREDNLAHVRQHENFHFVGGDIMHDTLVSAAMHEVELVLHLAAIVGVTHILSRPLEAILTNTRGTENVLKAAHEVGARVVFASTSEVYGASEELPFTEDSHRVLGPTWTHRWCYATAKALDEHLCFAYLDRGLDVSVVRYFNVFGTRMDPEGYGSVIAKFLSQALAGDDITVYGDGEQTRTFTHVDDAVEATILAGTLPQATGQAFNVGGKKEYSINDLARRILRVTGSSSPIVHVPFLAAYGPGFAETRRRVPDITKALRVLGWEPRIGLEAGLSALVAEREQPA